MGPQILAHNRPANPRRMAGWERPTPPRVRKPVGTPNGPGELKETAWPE